MATWLDGKLLKRIDWHDHLFSLIITCPDFPDFKAGQFTKVGIQQTDGSVLSRPYSLINSPADKDLEILAVPVEEGKLSPALHRLNTGDPVKIMSPATGFLVLDEIPVSDKLWLLATGTGVGPFVSILSTGQVWQNHQQVVLVYGVRYQADLAYLARFEKWQSLYPYRFHFVPVVSREKPDDGLRGRIPQLLTDGKVQRYCALNIAPSDSQVLLCGNPDMIQDSMAVLTQMGLSKHLRRSPGQISMERYW